MWVFRRCKLLCLTAFLGNALAQVPVVVELFTSEGCSSCPPAEALLAQISRFQPVPGARVIALEEHVDYWNQLGWHDPFSQALFRFRQNDYARLFGVESVFTPQMIVGGQAAFVGSDSATAYREIQAFAAKPAASVDLYTQRNARNADLLDLRISINNNGVSTSDANVYLAITEERLSTRVTRGENSGRTLRHAPVVRSFGVIGKLQPRKASTLTLSPTLQFPAEWRRENLRAVVFLQEEKTSRITGAATLDRLE